MLRVQKAISTTFIFVGAGAIGIFGLPGTSRAMVGLSPAYHSHALIQSGELAVRVSVIPVGAPEAQANESQEPATPVKTGSAASETSASTTSTGIQDETESVTLPVGTVISVRLADTVDSNHSHPGKESSGTVDPSVLVGNRVVIPRGTEAHIRMMAGKKGGRIFGHAEVQLALVEMIINGQKIDVETNTYDKKKGVLASKVKSEETPSANAAGDTAISGQPSGVANPVIAAFRAAKVVKPAGSKVDFTLTAPFTFAKPPEDAKP
jgi:hypothetical protein